MGGVGRGGTIPPAQRPLQSETPLIPPGRVCEGAGLGRALHLLAGRREPVLGRSPELWAVQREERLRHWALREAEGASARASLSP